MSRAFTGNTDSFNTRAFTDNNSSFNTNNSFNNVSIFTSADEEPKIRAWLSPLEPQVQHQDFCNQRVESVGDWLLETKEFRSWYNGGEKDESDHAVLFCYGDPGVGKSYISSLVVDYLCDQAAEQDTAVACFYYDFASRAEHSPANMLGSLLKQLLSGLEAIPEEIARKFRGQKRVIGGRELKIPDIVNMFPTVSTLQRVFICVDALDECVPKYRQEVLDSLEQILRKSPNTRLFMTGRSYIRGVVDRELGRRAKSLLIKPGDDDMVAYLRARLRKDTTPEVMDSGLEDDIMKSIPEEISESFLLVSLRVEAILRETTIHRRRGRLHAVGDALGLGDAYEATLVRIRAQDAEKTKLAMTALMWLCYSERPLQPAELCHALAVEIGSTDFNSENIPATETLLACCQGLVTVDKETTIFRLIHHTLREHLSTNPNLFPQAHSAIAETCLTYLNSDQVKALSAKPQPDLLSMPPFLKYSSRYWGTHANKELSDRARSLAMKLLAQFENHVAAESLFQQILEPSDPPRANGPLLFSGLHCASFFGIVEVMTASLGINGNDANQRDSIGITPFIWAVRSGHVKAVELLLGQEAINPDRPDNEGLTPLSWAAGLGHWSVVKQLLDRKDVNPDKPDNEGSTQLLWAVYSGHESVVKQLLDRKDVNPERPNDKGETPLYWAARRGHGSVIKQLVDREDVNPDGPDNEGRTPLYWAASNGHDSVVRQLLDRKDVNPDKPDNKGRTPLYWAASNGHDSVVRQLLDREEINPDKPGNKGGTPLHRAAARGHESVVKQLLNREDVNPDRPNDKGETPLYWAASKCHDSVVKQLLDREDVNPDKPDNEGRTPLYCAAINGHDSVVKQFLDREDVNPDKPDNEGRTPLFWAAGRGHGSVVKQLLDMKDVNPDWSDNEGLTPLSQAAGAGHESVVKQLLDRKDVNPDKPDNEGSTPLYWAANNGHDSVVKQFLDPEAVNPDKSDNVGLTPLSQAAAGGHGSVVRQLLDRKDVNPGKPDNGGPTPLHLAADCGHESVVKQPLDWRGVNPNKLPYKGGTPLLSAARKGCVSVDDRLLDCEDVNSDRLDYTRNPSASRAAIRGDEPLPDLGGEKASTPMHLATWAGPHLLGLRLNRMKQWSSHETMVKQILGQEDANPDKLD